MSNFFGKIIENVDGAYRSGLGVFQDDTPLVGVYGVTSVGKSTFLNALLKSKEFEVGLGETTKQVHVIKDFENQKTIDFQGASFSVKYAFKKMPLLKNFSIADVPGSNKSFSDEDVEGVIKRLDVIVWIFDVHGDVSQRDVMFLQNVILKNMVKSVVILNKIDSGMSDMDFDDVVERNEFISDIESRKESIVSLFRREQAEELLVAVIPMSSKKLFSRVTKSGYEKFDRHHKALEDLLISVSKTAFIQKEIFRDGYEKVKVIAKKEIDLCRAKVLKQKTKELESSLRGLSDKDVMEGRLFKNKLFDKSFTGFSVSGKYRDELEKIGSSTF